MRPIDATFTASSVGQPDGTGDVRIEWVRAATRPGDRSAGVIVVDNPGQPRDFKHLQLTLSMPVRDYDSNTSRLKDLMAEEQRLLGSGRLESGTGALRVPFELDVPWEAAAARLEGAAVHLAGPPNLTVQIAFGRMSSGYLRVGLSLEPVPAVAAVVRALTADGFSLRRAGTLDEKHARSQRSFIQRWDFGGTGSIAELEVRPWPGPQDTTFEFRIPRAYRNDPVCTFILPSTAADARASVGESLAGLGA